MSEVYTMTIAGLTRDLPLCPISDKTNIAGFVMFSDVELTVAASTALLERSPEFDVIVTAESKGIPLAYEMARQSGKPYVVARKKIKLYMPNPVSVTVKSITTPELIVSKYYYNIFPIINKYCSTNKKEAVKNCLRIRNKSFMLFRNLF